MSKSFKFKDNYFVDSKGIVHNKELLSTILSNVNIKRVSTGSSTSGFDIVPTILTTRNVFFILGIENGTTSGINAFFLRLDNANNEKIELGSRATTVRYDNGQCHVSSRNYSVWLIISPNGFNITQ